MTYTGTKAQSGRGTVLQIGGVHGAAGTEAFTTIGEIRTGGISGSQWKTVDVTNFQSNVDDEFITTTRSPGEVKIAGNRVSSDAGQAAVEAAYQTGLIYDFKETLPLNAQAGQTTSGDTFSYAALVMARDIEVDVSKEISWNVTLKITGPVSYTQGS